MLGVVYDLGSEARRWPFASRGDTMFYHLLAKSVIDDGWFLNVSLLGAPDTLNLRDVPTSDNNLHVLLLWRGMRDYDLLRGYLHSGHLRWSHGTIRGREGNAWLQQTSALPLDQLLETVSTNGFRDLVFGVQNLQSSPMTPSRAQAPPVAGTHE